MQNTYHPNYGVNQRLWHTSTCRRSLEHDKVFDEKKWSTLLGDSLSGTLFALVRIEMSETAVRKVFRRIGLL
jgi:hypothetical protein